MISIIIPAYKATKYIDECVSSIKGNVEHEILIGVDGCEETYNHIKHLDNVFFFPKNMGPFVIKNTLADVAKYDKLLFFDSDDIMDVGALDRLAKVVNSVDYVKLNYINFNNNRSRIDLFGHKMNDAIISIDKKIFNSLNGFYPWRCGADTEFTNRLVFNKMKSITPPDAFYYRRLHGENLTMKKETGHGSSIRNEYVNIINKNIRENNWPNPQIKTIQEYVKD
jgi:glycosyltransferase involved in cell wall biosynthesis